MVNQLIPPDRADFARWLLKRTAERKGIAPADVGLERGPAYDQFAIRVLDAQGFGWFKANTQANYMATGVEYYLVVLQLTDEGRAELDREGGDA
jgi:hypothetical protein